MLILRVHTISERTMTDELDQAWTLIQEQPLKLVFIAGPYFGDGQTATIEANIQQAERYAIALANAGVGFFCPHLHTRHFGLKAQMGEEFYHRLDFQYLLRSDAVLFLPQWRNSSGARREHAWATWRRLPCFYPSSPENLQEVVEWSNIASAPALLELEGWAEAARILLFEYSELPGWSPDDNLVRQQLAQLLSSRRTLTRP